MSTLTSSDSQDFCSSEINSLLRSPSINPEDLQNRYKAIVPYMRMVLYGEIWTETSRITYVSQLLAEATKLLEDGNLFLYGVGGGPVMEFIHQVNNRLRAGESPVVTDQDYPAILVFLQRTRTKLETIPET